MHPDKEYQIGSTAVRKRNSIKGEGGNYSLIFSNALLNIVRLPVLSRYSVDQLC